MTNILNSLMVGGDVTDVDYNIDISEPTFPNVPLHCCTEMDSSILDRMYIKASERDPDGGIPGTAPYIITKTSNWPLGFGYIESDEDDVFIIHPDRTESVSIESYGKTWVMYIGPENEPYWNTVYEFQK